MEQAFIFCDIDPDICEFKLRCSVPENFVDWVKGLEEGELGS